MLLYIAAVIVFLLAAFGVTVGGASELDEVAFGLGLFALAHLVP